MNRCKLCNKKKITIDCKYCTSTFCCYCILPEIHECEKILELKTQAQLELSETLKNSKCIKDKIYNRI